MVSSRKKLILLKLEGGTYGDDANPVGANAMEASSLEIIPLEADTVDRDLAKPYMGATPLIHVGEHVAINFSVELQSSGTLGTPPAFSPALRAAGMLEDIDVTTPGSEFVRYTPRSEEFESCTIYFYIDNVLHAATGSRADFSFGFEPKAISRLAFKFMGLYVGPVTSAPPVADWSAFEEPLPVGPWNSSDFLLFGSTQIAHKLDINAGFEVEYFPTLTTEAIRVGDRKSNGSLTIDEPALGSQNFIELVRANTTGPLSFQHGQTPGHIVVFDAPALQPLAPKFGDAKGTSTLEIGFNLLPVAGDDEWSLTFR